jgi:hypothetical protein
MWSGAESNADHDWGGYPLLWILSSPDRVVVGFGLLYLVLVLLFRRRVTR